MAKVTIYIDNQAYQVDCENNLLAGVLSQQLNLPYFCWHPSMGSVGACRQCAVTQYMDENDQRGRLVMACTTSVTEGMRIGLQEPLAVKFRQQVISAMMTNHPHDCPVCAEGGECHLQDMTVMTGHSARHYQGQKRTFTNQYLGEFVGHEMNRCITCYRCTRFYNDYAGGQDFGVYGSKNQVYFGRQTDGALESEFSGNLVEVCPTGVFTNKLFSAHFTRKWDLQSAPSICAHCSVGCNTSIGERYGSVRRVVNRFNEDINGYFLCDRGRFGIGFVNGEQRLNVAKGIVQKSSEKLTRLDVAKALSHHRGQHFIGIGSARASLAANAYLQQLVGKENFSAGFSHQQMTMAAEHLALVSKFPAPNLTAIEKSDFILIIGEDISQTAPRAALAVRQALRNLSFEKSADIGIPPWQDSAVRTIGGNRLSPLFSLHSTPTKLDDVSEASLLISEGEIIKTLDVLTAKLSGLTETSDEKTARRILEESLSAQQKQMIEKISLALVKAKQPLIISGWSMQSAQLLNRINHLMLVLHGRATAQEQQQQLSQLAIFPPQSNTLGVMSLLDETSLSTEQVLTLLENNSADGVILVEQELASFSNRQLEQLRQYSNVIIVMDHSESTASELADIVMPASAVSESDGHFVNYQGQIQRYYQVHTIANPKQESWRWLNLLAQTLMKQAPVINTFADLNRHLATVVSHWPIAVAEHKAEDNAEKSAAKELVKSAHHHSYEQTAIARQTHRNSGRTSQSANLSVHEPQTTQSALGVNHFEPELHFSMEGSGSTGSLEQPFTWAPGWNSNQAINQQSLGKNSADKCFISFEKAARLIEKYQYLPSTSPNEASSKHNVFVRQSSCFHDDWQANFTAEFNLKMPDNQLALARSQFESLGLAEGDFVQMQSAQHSVIGKAYQDERLSHAHSYGFFHQFTPDKTNLNVCFAKASESEISAHLAAQELRFNQAKKQQKKVLSRLKITDQMIPIRLVSGGLDDA